METKNDVLQDKNKVRHRKVHLLLRTFDNGLDTNGFKTDEQDVW